MTEHIANNLRAIRERIEAAAMRANRQPQQVRLIAVTKTVSVQAVRTLYHLGIRDFGENRPEQALDKIQNAPGDICWHMIGPIQSRKARDVVRGFSVAEGIDRVKIARVLQDRCEEENKTLEVMVEVNVSGEEAKHGFSPEDAADAVRAVREFDRLRLTGLMTMAPWNAPPEIIRDCFRRLNAMADGLGLPERSMGMTDDFEIAIEEGSTQVRIGRALFESS